MQKGYFLPIIGTLVLILILSIGGFYLQISRDKTSTPKPSTDPLTQLDYTRDWNVYTDKTYHFSFKYPKDWKFEEPSLENLHPNNKTLLQINLANPVGYDKNKILFFEPGKTDDHPSDPDKDPYAITIRVWDNRERKSLKEKLIEVDKFFQNSQQGYNPLLPQSDDAKEHLRNIQNVSGVENTEKVFVVGDYLYLISGAPMGSRANYKFGQITNTFKLTK